MVAALTAATVGPASGSVPAQLRGVATNIFTAQTASSVVSMAASQRSLLYYASLEADTPQSLALIAGEMAKVEAAGGSVVRLTLPWSLLETDYRQPGQPPDFDPAAAARISGFFTLAQADHLRVVVNFSNSPCGRSSAPWKNCASPGEWTTYPPVLASDYGNAVGEIIRRWGADIYGIEVWNEPNSQFFLDGIDECDPSDPAAVIGPSALATRAAAYVPLVDAAYRAVKASAYPHIAVVADGSAFADTTFLQDLYANGMEGHYDALSVHPYQLWMRFSPPPTTCAQRQHARLVWSASDPATSFPDPEFSFGAGLAAIHQVMAAHLDRAPIWITEMGFTSCQVAPAPLRGATGQWVGNADLTGACVGPTNQAAWLARSFLMAARLPYVGMTLMYSSRDSTQSVGPYAFDSFGFLESDLNAKPSYNAVKDAWTCLDYGPCS
ncbi:MAG TPA: hypothetical protein VE990_19230 [Acidimicrobiales bacterium]|nr:hypothetical protein [Acidimicrobiales bacterium]